MRRNRASEANPRWPRKMALPLRAVASGNNVVGIHSSAEKRAASVSGPTPAREGEGFSGESPFHPRRMGAFSARGGLP